MNKEIKLMTAMVKKTDGIYAVKFGEGLRFDSFVYKFTRKAQTIPEVLKLIKRYNSCILTETGLITRGALRRNLSGL